MLSYQHAFHAGNPADVHKHIALVALLQKLQRKDAPLAYVDSHAGRGVYDLASVEAAKTGEARAGILRLAGLTAAAGPSRKVQGGEDGQMTRQAAARPPAVVRDYLKLVAGFNEADRIRFYPGSASIARALLRPEDRAILLERHPQELAALRQAMRGDRRMAIHGRDCYEGLPALLPPPIRRGLVLIDPSYEVRDEYENVVKLLGKALSRWPNGVFALWYPVLPDRRHDALVRRLEGTGAPGLLISEYRFSASAVGLNGSALAVVNAPWQFDETLADAMGFVARALDVDGAGRYAQRAMG